MNAVLITGCAPSEPDFAWLSWHSWAWDPGSLDEVIRAAAPATLYVCGGADNELELADRFSQVFLPEIEDPQCWLGWTHAKTTSAAVQPLDQVVDAILARSS